jgi:hypothetical protein
MIFFTYKSTGRAPHNNKDPLLLLILHYQFTRVTAARQSLQRYVTVVVVVGEPGRGLKRALGL